MDRIWDDLTEEQLGKIQQLNTQIHYWDRKWLVDLST